MIVQDDMTEVKRATEQAKEELATCKVRHREELAKASIFSEAKVAEGHGCCRGL
ncbi:hypothetical protein PI125_g18883 [Phytophthora idaei]|nr:hypothetical protein PI125_g18883 [Phytophthora idaei]